MCRVRRKNRHILKLFYTLSVRFCRDERTYMRVSAYSITADHIPVHWINQRTDLTASPPLPVSVCLSVCLWLALYIDPSQTRAPTVYHYEIIICKCDRTAEIISCTTERGVLTLSFHCCTL